MKIVDYEIDHWYPMLDYKVKPSCDCLSFLTPVNSNKRLLKCMEYVSFLISTHH